MQVSDGLALKLSQWKHVRFLRSCRALCAAGIFAALALVSQSGRAIEIEVRLMCDLTGMCGPGDFFHDHPDALETLEFATTAFEPFADQLAAVTVPSVTFQNPDPGVNNFSIAHLDVPANTLIVYAGAHELSGSRAGEAAPGGPLNTFSRGQGVTAGAGAVDFAPWGGAIAFDATAPGGASNWHFDAQTNPAPGRVDFLSVALHELAHLFGFGTSDSFTNQITSSHFTGDNSTALYGENVPLFADNQHWGENVTSPPYENQVRVALGPTLTTGRRTLLSPLDYAALADVGWEVPAQLLGLHGNSDGDTDVDGGDFLAWQRGNGLGHVGALQGNFNGDHAVDDYDLWLWKLNFGATATPLVAATSTTVPEPGSISLVLVVVGGWMLVVAASRPRRQAAPLFALAGASGS